MKFVLLLFCLTVRWESVNSIIPPLASYDDQVTKLLNSMTDEEKVGQMTQVTIAVILKDATLPWDKIEIDPEKLKLAIQDYHIGSILNVADSGAYPIQQWQNIITQIQDQANQTRLRIPVLYGIDSIHGANYIRDAVLFPQAIALAASFNPTLAYKLGQIVAHQTRAAGIPWNFHPQVDIGRQKLWPRLWETYGEDVTLVKDMGREYTQGMQGDDLTSRETVAACLKHYVGYGMPLSGRDRTPAWIDERHMLEYYLPPFEESIHAGAVSVMINSGEVNGIPGHANYHLLTEVLKDTYGFQGFTVSDWEDIIRLHTRDHTAATLKEAARQAVMAGVDMSMVPFSFSFYNDTLACVKEGSIPQSRLNDAVRRILRVKFALGLFNGRNAWPDPSALATFNKAEYDEINLNATREVVTLLKNENGILPLNPRSISQTNKLIVTGPSADLLTVLNGGWSYVWQGNNELIYPTYWRNKTILESIKSHVYPNSVQYFNTSSFDQYYGIEDLVNASNDASYIVVCLGERPYTETPGNINELTMDEAQLRLVEEIKNRTNKPIITVLVEGRPRIIRRIVPLSSAIIMMYLPGMEGGRALADVLFGKYNPSGRLPITYPKYEHRLSTYDYKWNEVTVDNSIEVEYPFGHGLSYTTFIYSNLVVPQKIAWDDSIRIKVDVLNNGTVFGDHTVLLYVSDLYRTITPPNKELKSYNKAGYEAGQRRTIEFTLNRDTLSFIGIDMKRITESGTFQVTVGDLQENFELMPADSPVSSTSKFVYSLFMTFLSMLILIESF